MKKNIWKRLQDIKPPECIICEKTIYEEYFTEHNHKIICELCAREISDLFSEL